MKTFWYALLDWLLGGWLLSAAGVVSDVKAKHTRQPRPDVQDWMRAPDHFEQAKVYLADDAAWLEWFQSFTPDALIEPQGERESEVYEAPTSFPCVVIATRRLGSGLVRADFYWDFVYPADFPQPVQPDTPVDWPINIGPPGAAW